MVQPEHGLVDDEADDDGGREEEDGVHQHLHEAGVRAAAGTQHAGEHHDADDVINDCRADDGRTKEAFQMAQLLQRRHRDGDARRRHDGADEEGTVELGAAHRRKAVECAIQQRTAYQRHKDADAGDQRRNGACAHQLLQVRAKAGGEHQQNNADFSHT